QRRLLVRAGERPRGGRAAVLAEGEAQLARRAQAVGMSGPEGRAGLVEVQSTEQVATEVALVARDLLRCGATLRHSARPPRQRTHQTSRMQAGRTGPRTWASRNCRAFPPRTRRGCKRPDISPSAREEPASCGRFRRRRAPNFHSANATALSAI